ncbi:MAG: phosphate ABC transporter permease subunit PstC, partial [Acidimicrobiales bacterium]|nr:phosphate ABC transporter permease subunit PstC [Acidimicrobiales bacterium]
MATTLAPDPPVAALRARNRQVGERSFRVIALVSGLMVLVVLGLIALTTTSKAWQALSHEGVTFVTSTHWDPANGKFGAFAYIYGTLISSLIAIVIGVPVSVGIALVLTEVAPRNARRGAVYLIDLLAAVPSVVFGLWGLLVAAGPLGRFYGHVSNVTRHVPVLNTLFTGGIGGRCIFTAGLVLALMIVPIITSLTREVFQTVPPAQKEAALALGATRWEMIRGSVLPYGRSGVVGAVMLGLGRAMGETIAVALLIGSVARVTAHLFSAGDTMAAVIVNQFGDNQTGLAGSAFLALGV